VWHAGPWIRFRVFVFSYRDQKTPARYGLALLLMFCVLATLYRFGTSVKRRFTFISPGALFTVIVWFVLGQTFRFYVDKFGKYEKTYGTVGGVTIILLFFYLDALVVMAWYYDRGYLEVKVDKPRVSAEQSGRWERASAERPSARARPPAAATWACGRSCRCRTSTAHGRRSPRRQMPSSRRATRPAGTPDGAAR
jgi:hypothetical protein